MLLALAPPARAQNGIGISVSPTAISPLIATGDATGETITLINRSAAAIIVTGVPDAGGQQDNGVGIEVQPAEVDLPPAGSARVIIRITVAAGAPVGSSRRLVSFQVRPASGGNISVTGTVDVVLKVDVFQPVVDTSFSAPLLIDGSAPAVFSQQGSNNDKIPVRLSGSVNPGGLLGGAALSAQSRTVASGKSASLQEVWRDPPAFGIGWVTMRIGSGVGSPVQRRAFVVIFPWKFALVLAGLAATAAAGFVVAGRWR